MTIFSKVSNFFSSFGNTIGNAFSSGYSEVKDVVRGVGTEIDKQADQAHQTLNNIIQDGSNLANKAIDKGTDLIKNTENKISSTITMPLILIAAGIGGLLLFKGDRIVEVGANAAAKAAPIQLNKIECHLTEISKIILVELINNIYPQIKMQIFTHMVRMVGKIPNN